MVAYAAESQRSKPTHGGTASMLTLAVIAMGITKYLKAGRISINKAAKQIEIADKQLILPYDKLNDSDWGYVYEKYVGQVLEDEGYEVNYHGLQKGFSDRGIDLIAIKDNEMKFVQCKYTRVHFPPGATTKK